ncbi:forkhead box protein O isoform X2 [Anoplophora glabripennis]|uniref:Forkhead box protein O n=1 Tax=Anoplophora glabripennis TaxID=217634 RepID=V5G1W6_ANOGL|nr:forkhead box protein O isoform X2 [Anoplophora glabripennis]
MNGPYGAWPVKMNLNIMEPVAEHGDGFEPQTRARSNTWPLPRPDNYVEPGEEGGGNKCPVPMPAAASASVPAKKNSSRRNAWGNLSYADLITQAITTSPDKRLTLSQIYEWMVQNVPYFKDKGDSNSSAGWKNSIRHNLSLHNRFMRVQNEGTGKSSWWMINPDAKPGKSVRRRAASMETSKFEKKRGRAKKKVEILRNGGGCLPDTTPSPSSSVSESLDLFPDSPIHSGFQLSPDFRPRASSNTSSCGRLSPIPSVGVEPVWTTPEQYTNSNYSPEMVSSGNYSPDTLAGSMEQGMKLQPSEYLGYINGQNNQQPPPPYTAPYETFHGCRDINALHATSPYGLTQCPIHRMQSCSCMQPIKVESMSPAGMSPSYPHSEPSPDPLTSQFMINRMPRPSSSSPPLTPQPPTQRTLMGQILGALNNSSMLDDISVESLQGGFECNVDEVIKHELKMDGSLDFNFPNQQQEGMPPAEARSDISNSQTSAPPSYSAAVTAPSWVH